MLNEPMLMKSDLERLCKLADKYIGEQSALDQAFLDAARKRLRVYLAKWGYAPPCDYCWGVLPENFSLQAELQKVETKLRNIRQTCEDTPREPGDMESADIPSTLLDVLTGALDEIQEEDS